MADAAVSFAIKNVGDFLIQEGKFLYGVRGQVQEMQSELKRMQCFLKDADAEANKGESNSVRNWVSEIREATYDVEDLIERFVLKSAFRSEKGVVNRIKKYASFLNHLLELHQAGSRIGAIKAKLSNLRTSLQIYGIRDLGVGGEGVLATSSRRKRQDYPHVVDHNVVGLDQKMNELVQQLLDFEEGKHHRPKYVVCLYGMGGLGKTTIAKKVYTDYQIKAYFECFAWVYISQQCNPKQVWESILSQLSGDKDSARSMSEDELISQLYHLQKEKRCLLVIDDIWRSQDWIDLSAAFPYTDRDNRSKILLTTRNEGVVASHGVYRTSLDILDQSNSLELLKYTILFRGDPTHPLKENSNMDEMAVEMVKECKGLPLAIIVLGGVLATKHTFEDWKRVGVNIKSVLKRGEQKGKDGVAMVLESSYEDLPYNLKSCFLHFSQYPEDTEMKTIEVIQRWMAEGFVRSSSKDGDETTEDVAEEYLIELINRCMIQVGRKGHTGRVKTCRMHDLMRDLSISKAKEEGFAHSMELGVENQVTTLPVEHRIRRISIYDRTPSDDDPIVPSLLPRLRSLSWFSSYSPRPGPMRGSSSPPPEKEEDYYRKFRLTVNSLKLVRIIVDHHPPNCERIEHIGNLIHLRFLKIGLSDLPTSISNLRCLQTLKLNSDDWFKVEDLPSIRIPNSLWRLEQLRHLYLPVKSHCESTKQRVGNFLNLQTLVNFPPKEFDLQQNLVKFKSVRKFVIIESFREIGEVLRSQAIVFNRLESLSFLPFTPLSFWSLFDRHRRVDIEAVTRTCPRLYRLVLKRGCTDVWPSNLTKLVLENTKLDESEMGTLAKLHSLKVLFLLLDSFEGEEMVFHTNDFPQLRHLSLERLPYLEAWMVHEGGLPSLSRLDLNGCKKLMSVWDGIHYLKQLKELRVINMSYGFERRLEQDRDQWDGVSHVPSIYFY